MGLRGSVHWTAGILRLQLALEVGSAIVGNLGQPASVGRGLKENVGTAEVPVDDGVRGHVVEVVEGTGHVNGNGEELFLPTPLPSPPRMALTARLRWLALERPTSHVPSSQAPPASAAARGLSLELGIAPVSSSLSLLLLLLISASLCPFLLLLLLLSFQPALLCPLFLSSPPWLSPSLSPVALSPFVTSHCLQWTAGSRSQLCGGISQSFSAVIHVVCCQLERVTPIETLQNSPLILNE